MKQEEFNALVEKTAEDLMNACEGSDRRYILLVTDERNQARLSSHASINQIANMLFNSITRDPDIRRAARMVFSELVEQTFTEQPKKNASSKQ